MKTLTALTIAVFLPLAGPAPAETPVAANSAEACPLVGRVADPSADCKALRVAYQTGIGDCMDKLKDEADARAGKETASTSHSSRARYLLCNASFQNAVAAPSE